MKLPSLSIVVPCHNEEATLPTTLRELDALVHLWLGKLISSCEYVLVNNGSTDRTLAVMRSLSSSEADLQIVDLRRNFGYQGSITAGLHHASGDVSVTIDCDLQDDPACIEAMLEQYRQGHELVLGVRKSRSSDSALKRVTAQAYYRLLSLLGVEGVYNHGDFRLMSRALVEEFKSLPETNRYLRSLIVQLDSNYGCVYYDRRTRKAGRTKFTPGRLIALAIDGITSFSSVPIRIVTFAGVGMFGVSFLGLAYVAYILLFAHRGVPGWASLATILLFFSGIQMLSLGIVGEYVAKTYTEVKRRPLFVVRNVYRQSRSPTTET